MKPSIRIIIKDHDSIVDIHEILLPWRKSGLFRLWIQEMINKAIMDGFKVEIERI